jgi:glycosyltransferase involved in cell wall biosynthesis
MTQVQRVLHVLGGMNRGGAETLIMNILRNLDRTKLTFDFVVHTDEECSYDKEINNLGGSIFHLPKPGILTLLEYKRKLKSVIESNSPYIAVHSHVFNFSGIVLSVAHKKGINNRISHSHNTIDGKDNSLIRHLYRVYARSKITKYSTMKIGCSKEACESLFGEDCWLDNKTQVIRNAIDSRPYKLLARKSNVLKMELGISSDSILLGHIGRFTTQKNHEFLINLFEQYIKKVPNSHLVLIGDGLLRRKIEELIRTKKLEQTVHFLGIRSDIISILSGLDSLLLPSLHEGLPLVMIEAQAAGLPCVVADTVTKESDLDLNLIVYRNLGDSIDDWIDGINQALLKPTISWEYRYEALVNRGFEIKETVARLEKLYA